MAGPRRASSRRGPRAPVERSPEEELAYAKERALRLLAVRPRSRWELRSRLARAGIEGAAVDDALTDLERVGLVDDERFAADFAAHRLEGRREGVRAARSALRAKGLASEVVERALEGAEEGEEERAEELAAARASRLGGEPPERALVRLTAFLQRRGYGYGVASRAARRGLGFDADPDGAEPTRAWTGRMMRPRGSTRT